MFGLLDFCVNGVVCGCGCDVVWCDCGSDCDCDCRCSCQSVTSVGDKTIDMLCM